MLYRDGRVSAHTNSRERPRLVSLVFQTGYWSNSYRKDLTRTELLDNCVLRSRYDTGIASVINKLKLVAVYTYSRY